MHCVFVADVEYILEVVGVEHAVLLGLVGFEHEVADFLLGYGARLDRQVVDTLEDLCGRVHGVVVSNRVDVATD